MKHALTDPERNQLNQRIAAVEKRTGAQIILAIVERSDSYAELPWKAFALGASIGGRLVSVLSLLRPEWTSSATVLTAVVTTLASGAIAALLCVFVPGFARLFLHAHRAELEAQEHAKSLFLSHELFATHKRTGLLLLVSLFERHVVILPDTGLDKRLSKDEIQRAIAQMAPILASGQVALALERGLSNLEGILVVSAPGRSTKNELPDEIIEEKGI
jgi:putative membrane protein